MFKPSAILKQRINAQHRTNGDGSKVQPEA
ncbi:hypothetical protein ACVW1A_007371 [Bradyrhizobium sp. LB1.3]